MMTLSPLSSPPPAVVPVKRPTAPGGYQPQFDGLRALAVITVIVDHFAANVPNFPLPDWIRLGPIGVRLFLVLSGYFITGSLTRTRARIDAGRQERAGAFADFYRRRGLRILPPYALFAAVSLALGLGVTRQYVGWLLTFSVNWLIAWTDQWPPAMSHLWSICVQEQFYLLWPALIFLLPRRWILPSILACAAGGVVFRILCVQFSVPLIARWVLPFGSMDALGIGAVLAWGGRALETRLKPRHPLCQILAAVACVGALLTAAVLRNGDPARLISVCVEPLEALALAWVVACASIGVTGLPGWLLTRPALLYAGRMSYGIYLYHILVSICLDQWTPPPWRWMIEIPAMRIVTLGTATLAVSALSWEFVEKPIDRWRRK